MVKSAKSRSRSRWWKSGNAFSISLLQYRSRNDFSGLLSLDSISSLSHGIPIVLSSFQSPPSSYIPLSIESYHHHYQSLTTPNDVTIPFATKCSIIIPFNCLTLDLFFSSMRFRHSAPLCFQDTGYGQAYPDRILLPCQPTSIKCA